MNKLLFADDLVLMSGSMEILREKLLGGKEAFESKGVKVKLGMTKLMVSG